MRKVEVDIRDLIDIFIAGLDGDWQDYMFDFLIKVCNITEDEVIDYAVELGKHPPYSKEDTGAVLDKAKEYWAGLQITEEDW